MPPGYESFFGLFERPFSLTPDARYHFRSRAHARALAGLSAGLARQAPILLLTGDLGTGKSTLCRTLARTCQRTTMVSYIANGMMSPEEMYRRLLQDLAAVEPGEGGRRRLAKADRRELGELLADSLTRSSTPAPLVMIDEAHLLPPVTVDHIIELASLDRAGRPLVQVLMASQPSAAGLPTLPRVADELVLHRARLTPLDRDECEAYIQHRLNVAGAAPIGIAPRTVDVLYGLSGGVPRLVNLLCERAMQEAAATGVRRLEHTMLETAAASLALLRLRSQRFRWFGIQRRAAQVSRGAPVPITIAQCQRSTPS
jgi:general secretion pathway protein A